MKEFTITIPELKHSLTLLKDSMTTHQVFGNTYRINEKELFADIRGLKLSAENCEILIVENWIDVAEDFDFVLHVKSIDDFKLNRNNEFEWIKYPKHYSDEDYFIEKKRTVTHDWKESFTFKMSNEQETEGLREPQHCALHAIHTHWPNKLIQTQTIVLPTGTGKTETMISAVVSCGVKTTLIIVPSDALRTQIANKFSSLGILRYLDVVSLSVQNPTVSILKNKIQTADDVRKIIRMSNVIVTTIHTISQIDLEAIKELRDSVDLLVFDEAHHEAAEKWRKLSESFKSNKVLQFTATPYRNDNKNLSGQITYNFPLKRAQELGYFSKINFESICVFSQEESDKLIASKAIERLRIDNLENNKNHILMARVAKIQRAEEIKKYYEDQSDFKVTVVNSYTDDIEQVKKGIKNKDFQIIICVNMLGEGFDLPELKIAAMHDNHKSLPVFLQFIGRFARNRPDLGDAYIVANIDSDQTSESMSEIWNSSDWNTVISHVSHEQINQKVELQNFLDSFNFQWNEQFPIQSLKPTLSVVVYDVSLGLKWDVKNVANRLKGKTVYENDHSYDKMYLCIKEVKNEIKWIENDDLIQRDFNLYIFYYNEELKLLFVSGGSEKSYLKRPVKELVGNGAVLKEGELIFRCLNGLRGAMLVNLGSYTPYQVGQTYEQRMGRSLNESLSSFEKSVRGKSNFFCHGYEEGQKVTIGCTKKGRIWSFAHENILGYKKWCDKIGGKLLNTSLQELDFIKGFIVPINSKRWPENENPIAVDWSGDLYTDDFKNVLTFAGKKVFQFEVEISIIKFDNGVLGIEFSTDYGDKSEYNVYFENEKLKYVYQKGSVITVEDNPLVSYLSDNQLRIWFHTSNYLEGTEYYQAYAKAEEIEFDNGKINSWDFIGNNVDITKESQRFDPYFRTDSIQYYVIQKISDRYDLIVNDDGPNEVSDIVAIRIVGNELMIDFFHCKNAHEGKITSRVDNFDVLCGQVQKMIRKVLSIEKLFEHLKKRHKLKMKTAKSPRIIKGDEAKFDQIAKWSKVVPKTYSVFIVQPGVSPELITPQIHSLLLATEHKLKQYNITVDLICSENEHK